MGLLRKKRGGAIAHGVAVAACCWILVSGALLFIGGCGGSGGGSAPQGTVSAVLPDFILSALSEGLRISAELVGESDGGTARRVVNLRSQDTSATLSFPVGTYSSFTLFYSLNNVNFCSYTGEGATVAEGAALSPTLSGPEDLGADQDGDSISTLTELRQADLDPLLDDSQRRPTIADFSAADDTILLGESVTLKYEVIGPTQCLIEPGGGSIAPPEGEVKLSGELVLTISATTSYKMTCENEFGAEARTVSVLVGEPPKIAGFDLDPSAFAVDGSLALALSVTGEKSCSVDPQPGTVDPQNPGSVSPTATTTYTLTCTNDFGEAESSKTFEIVENLGSPDDSAPRVEFFSASPSYARQGDTVTLAWKVQNADSCALDPGGALDSLESQQDVAPDEPTKYTLSCVNGSGLTRRSIEILPDADPLLESFKADPENIDLGQATTLSWSAPGAWTCTISPDVGVVGAVGWVRVSPMNDVTYSLNCRNPEGEVYATTKVGLQAVPTLAFDYEYPAAEDYKTAYGYDMPDGEVLAGDSVNLRLLVTGTPSPVCEVGPGPISWTGNLIEVTPTEEQTTYTATCRNEYGEVEKSLTIDLKQLIVMGFKGAPSSIDHWSSSTLSWTAKGQEPIDCRLTDEDGAEIQSPYEVAPLTSANYTLTCTGPSGSADATATVSVCDADAPCWSPALPKGKELNAIWGSDGNDFYIVGDGGLIIHYVSTVPHVIDPLTTRDLNHVWGGGASDVWIVGDDGVVLHKGAGDWSSVDAGATADLVAVWGDGDGNVYVMETLETGLIRHYDGNSWTLLTEEEAVLVRPSIQEEADFWFDDVGTPYSITSNTQGHYSVNRLGSAGGIVYTDQNNELRDIWGVGASDFYVVGSNGTIVRLVDDFATRQEPWMVQLFDVRAVRGTASNRVFVAGGWDSSVQQWDGKGFVISFDGSTWNAMLTHDEPLLDLWTCDASRLAAVGKNSVLRYDGSAWTSEDGPSSAYRSVWCAGTTVYVPDQGGALYRSTAGGAWQSAGVGSSVLRLWGSGASDIYASAADGATGRIKVLHYDGASWSEQSEVAQLAADLPALDYLAQLHGRSAGEVYVLSRPPLRLSSGVWTKDEGAEKIDRSFAAAGFDDNEKLWPAYSEALDLTGLWMDGIGVVTATTATGGVYRIYGSLWTFQESGTSCSSGQICLDSAWTLDESTAYVGGTGSFLARYGQPK